MGSSWSDFVDIAAGRSYDSALRNARRRLRERGHSVGDVHKDYTGARYMKIDAHWYIIDVHHVRNRDAEISQYLFVSLHYVSVAPTSIKKHMESWEVGRRILAVHARQYATQNPMAGAPAPATEIATALLEPALGQVARADRKRSRADAFATVEDREAALEVERAAVGVAAATLVHDLRTAASGLTTSFARVEHALAAFERVHARGVVTLENHAGLPPEVFEMVLTFVALPDLIALASACKEWRSAILTRVTVGHILEQWERTYGVELFLPRDALRKTPEPSLRDLLRVLGYGASQVFAETGQGLRNPEVRKMSRTVWDGDTPANPGCVAAAHFSYSYTYGRRDGYACKETLLSPWRPSTFLAGMDARDLVHTPTRQIALTWTLRVGEVMGLTDLTRGAPLVELPFLRPALVNAQRMPVTPCGCVGEAVFLAGPVGPPTQLAVVMVDYAKPNPVAVRILDLPSIGELRVLLHVTGGGGRASVWYPVGGVDEQRLEHMPRLWKVARVDIAGAKVLDSAEARLPLSAAPHIRQTAKQFRARLEGDVRQVSLGPCGDRFACSTPFVSVMCKAAGRDLVGVTGSFFWHRDGCVRRIGKIEIGTRFDRAVLSAQEVWPAGVGPCHRSGIVFVETTPCPATTAAQ